MKAFQELLTYTCLVGAFVLATWCVALACKRQISLAALRLLDEWRRLGNFGRVMLVVFVSAMIVYGSTKTNATDNAGGEATNPPPTTAGASRTATDTCRG